jgi:hydroxymethylpyrimidine pyrophosphatase-like HAD family hydrolase
MRYAALACDYDGTIARHGVVDDATIAALERVRQSGRRLILVTGRQLSDLHDCFSRIDLFDRVVAENGAVVYDPVTREQRLLGDAPPAAFVTELRRLHVEPLSIGSVIVATWEPQQAMVLDVIRRMGLELHVIFNKGAVMVLPSGLNKATGLRAALESLQISAHNVVGIGDAENDHAFLSICECAVATANAVDTLKTRADIVTTASHGDGVIELVADLIETDLAGLNGVLARHDVSIGTSTSGEDVRLKPLDRKVLVAGPSGSGKSTLVTAFLEALIDAKYQVCLIDPEGDYDQFPDAVRVGDAEREPTVAEVTSLLAVPTRSVVVNMLAIKIEQRPAFFASLLPGLLQMRAKIGRPHWTVIDEAHHLLPADIALDASLAADLYGVLFITVHPDQIWRPALDNLDVVFATGSEPEDVLRAVPQWRRPAGSLPAQPATGEAVMWTVGDGTPIVFRPNVPHSERLRHRRKYATGELGPDRSFFFTGPHGALNLRAQNLMLFMQMADGVDDETWIHHLRAGDYSRWFREAIKDEDLARIAVDVERDRHADPAESRRRIREAIEERYTKPAAVERN